jgi:hypothetical protein
MKNLLLGAALALLSVFPAVCQVSANAVAAANPGMFTLYTGDCHDPRCVARDGVMYIGGDLHHGFVQRFCHFRR